MNSLQIEVYWKKKYFCSRSKFGENIIGKIVLGTSQPVFKSNFAVCTKEFSIHLLFQIYKLDFISVMTYKAALLLLLLSYFYHCILNYIYGFGVLYSLSAIFALV